MPLPLLSLYSAFYLPLPLLSLYSDSCRYYCLFVGLIRATIAAFLAIAIAIAIMLIRSCCLGLLPLPAAPATAAAYSLFPLLIAPIAAAALPYIIPLGLFYF